MLFTNACMGFVTNTRTKTKSQLSGRQKLLTKLNLERQKLLNKLNLEGTN